VDLVYEVIIPSAIIVVIPMVIPIIIIGVYRRLRFSDIVAGKLNINAKYIAYAMVGVTLLSPQHFYAQSSAFNPLEFAISGAFWRFWSTVNPPLMFGFLGDAMTTFLLLLFSYEIYRCYQARSTRKRAIIIGLLSLIMPIYLGIQSIIYFLPSPFFFVHGPIPFTLVLGIAILFLLPPPELPKTWDEGMEQVHEE
jgi:hypothetical protein